ncbi:MAG: HEAT repeat domain-containing protein [Deltaproteobacteria bacterium]|nr:HEAT repeat domain-containing protein [Deltaproteobacteria bacterium]
MLAAHLARLASPLPADRDAAQAALVAAGELAVEPLVAALSSSDRTTRSGAALCLGRLGHPSAVNALLDLLDREQEASVRPLVLRAIADLARPGAPVRQKLALLDALGDQDLFCRALACRGLGQVGDADAREALHLALRDPEPWVRQAATEALRGVGPSAEAQAPPPAGGAALATTRAAATADPSSSDVATCARWLMSLDLHTQRQAQARLRHFGAPAIPHVAPLLWDELPSTRRAAVEVLGQIGDASGLPHLARLLELPSTSSDLQAVALQAVAQIAATRVRMPAELSARLEQLRSAADPYVRAGAIAASIRGGGPGRAHAVRALLDDEEEWVHEAGCRALAESLTLEDGELRDLLVDGLARLTDPTALTYLLGALARVVDPDHDEDRQVVGPASHFLRHTHRAVRIASAALVAQVGRDLDPRTLKDLLDLAEEEASEAGPLVEALPQLCRLGDPLPAATLRRILLGSDPALARQAARALARLGGRAAVDALVEVANGRHGGAVALAAQELAHLNPDAEVVAVRDAAGRWERRLLLRCTCAAHLRWVERNDREELRCPSCDAEYAMAPSGKVFAADRTPFGLCLCPTCRRKQVLVRRPEGETLVCPVSAEVHVRPFDHPRQLRRLAELPLGACHCCVEPQPLVRQNDRVVCYRTREEHVAAARGFLLARGQVPPDVSSINQALLDGTLGIGESGTVAVVGRRDEEG